MFVTIISSLQELSTHVASLEKEYTGDHPGRLDRLIVFCGGESSRMKPHVCRGSHRLRRNLVKRETLQAPSLYAESLEA
jgi:hypothetical protein